MNEEDYKNEMNKSRNFTKKTNKTIVIFIKRRKKFDEKYQKSKFCFEQGEEKPKNLLNIIKL